MVAEGRGTYAPETSPDPGAISEPPTPHCSILYPRFSYSLVCAIVISLMTCNALKALHQPDLLKRSMGNALGHFSSHPQPLSLSHRPCLSVSRVSLLPSSLLSICSPRAAFLPICLIKLSPLIISGLSLPFSPFLFLSLPLLPPPPHGVWTGPLNQQHQRKWTRGIWPLPLSLRSA